MKTNTSILNKVSLTSDVDGWERHHGHQIRAYLRGCRYIIVGNRHLLWKIWQWCIKIENLYGLPYGWSQALIWVGAPESNNQQTLHLFHVKLHTQFFINYFMKPFISIWLPNPTSYWNVRPLIFGFCWSFSACYFQCHYAEAKDIWSLLEY